jgi:hypothetical protein
MVPKPLTKPFIARRALNPPKPSPQTSTGLPRSPESRWSVRFDANTPLELSSEALHAMALLVEALHAAAAAAAAAAQDPASAAAAAAQHRTLHVSPRASALGAGRGVASRASGPTWTGAAALRRLALRCVWNLSATHPAVAQVRAAGRAQGPASVAGCLVKQPRAALKAQLQWLAAL